MKGNQYRSQMEGDTMHNHEKALPPGWEFTGCYPGGRDTHSGNLMRCLE